jgi:hypothetical protein
MFIAAPTGESDCARPSPRVSNSAQAERPRSATPCGPRRPKTTGANMPKYKLVVLTRPKDGQEAEYNNWYQNTHIPEVLSIPGYKSAQRFKLNTPMMAKDPMPYLAIYDVETSDIGAVLQESGRRAQSGEMTASDAVDNDASYVVFYEEFGPRVDAKS